MVHSLFHVSSHDLSNGEWPFFFDDGCWLEFVDSAFSDLHTRTSLCAGLPPHQNTPVQYLIRHSKDFASDNHLARSSSLLAQGLTVITFVMRVNIWTPHTSWWYSALNPLVLSCRQHLFRKLPLREIWPKAQCRVPQALWQWWYEEYDHAPFQSAFANVSHEPG